MYSKQQTEYKNIIKLDTYYLAIQLQINVCANIMVSNVQQNSRFVSKCPGRQEIR